MLIIIEGPDLAGKSTLAASLALELAERHPGDRVRVLHRGPPTRHPLDEYERPLWDYRPGTGEHIICDRWHVGEMVYPELLDRPTSMDVAVWRHIDLFLQSRGALVVTVRVDSGEAWSRLAARTLRREPVSPLDQLLVQSHDYVVRRFGELLRHPVSGVPHVTYDGGRWGDETAVIRAATAAESGAVPLNSYVTYVGPPDPTVLLLGDVRGVDGRLAFGPGPAFVPYPATSGHYLLSHLPTLAFGDGEQEDGDTWSVGLANACDSDHIPGLVKTLCEPRVVALGRKAARRLHLLGLADDAGAVPHPQFVRRFHHHDGHRYAAAIRHAAISGEDMSSWRP